MGVPANPMVTPEHIKPEWYFYFSFRLLKLTSLKISVYLTGVLFMVIFFWPFLEQWLTKKFHLSEKVPIILGVIAFAVFLRFTVWESIAV